ncbi:MAG TPA: hypothetical protein VLH08_19605 [Acidobacteriota bacterium]|nr:hypothetical protein [Acidobacteriota bacterium]
MKTLFATLFLFLLSFSAFAMDEMTIYELLDPTSHKFAIQYDVSATEPGSKAFFNIIRPGSEASNEKVIDRATGKELPYEMSNGKEAKAAGQADKETSDETKFIKVPLPHPVPQEGEYRLRIFKTYLDPKSYFVENNLLIFDRSLGVKRNIVILPAGYELIGCTVPAIVSQDSDGRIRVSMVNDRDDELGMRITARKIKNKK